MNKLQHTATRMLLMAMALQGIAAVAGEIPVQLPKPDGKPGEATKPVKVYLLAGQSNMNGMGDLTGARAARGAAEFQRRRCRLQPPPPRARQVRLS
jgi:hypothetical protein